MDTEERIKRLKRIKSLLTYPKYSPKASRWMFEGMFYLLVTSFGCYCQEGGDEFLTLWNILFILTSALSITCGFCSVFPDSRQNMQLMEQQIADYDPIDRNLYEALCEPIRLGLGIDYAAVEAWHRIESENVLTPLARSA